MVNIIIDYGVTDASDLSNIAFTKNAAFSVLSDEKWSELYRESRAHFSEMFERLKKEGSELSLREKSYDLMSGEERIACMNFIYSLIDAPIDIAYGTMNDDEWGQLWAPIMFWTGDTQACKDAYHRLSNHQQSLAQ